MNNLKILRVSMLTVAFISFSMGAGSALDDDMVLALINIGSSLFFIFLAINTELLLVKSIPELDNLIPKLVDQKFLWVGIGIGLLGIFWHWV